MKRCLVIRCGAMGDVLEATSVCASLKKQGWYTTLVSTPYAAPAVRNNPNVDEVIEMVVRGRTFNEVTTEWKQIAMSYEKFINLHQIVEGTLLLSGEQIAYNWHPAARHKLCNHNYLEFLHLACGVPYERGQIRFYPDTADMDWANELRSKIREPYILLNITHGSSTHKIWPHQRSFIYRVLMKYQDLHVIMAGTEQGKDFEAPHVDHPRVTLTSATLDLRKFLTLPFISDIMMTPETGIAYAASNMDLPKLVFLSHATEENLTRDWNNAYTFHSGGMAIECKGRGKNYAPACHQIHNNWDTCTRVVNLDCRDCMQGKCAIHLAACQQAITVDKVYPTFDSLMERLSNEARAAA
jgi:ADP-heptose:LPS heptosyltransferase